MAYSIGRILDPDASPIELEPAWPAAELVVRVKVVEVAVAHAAAAEVTGVVLRAAAGGAVVVAKVGKMVYFRALSVVSLGFFPRQGRRTHGKKEAEGQGVDGSVAPALVEEAASRVEPLKVLIVGGTAEEVEAGDLKVAPEVAQVIGARDLAVGQGA